MECPNCKNAMTVGAVSLEYTWSGLLAAGVSRLTLFFTGKGDERIAILESETLDALRCSKCGMVVIQAPNS